MSLAMIAGFLDAYGIITYDTYVSFMSGNTTQAGYKIGEGNCWGAAHSALAIVFFVGGSFAGALLAHSGVRRIQRLVFGVVAASLALIVGFTQLGFSSGWVPIAVVSFAMGAMNTALSRVRRTIREPDLCNRDVEQDWSATRARGQACASSGQPGIVGYTFIPGCALGRYLGRVPDRRIVVGGGDTALWSVGFTFSHAYPVGAGGVRPDYERDSLISMPRPASRGDMRVLAGPKNGPKMSTRICAPDSLRRTKLPARCAGPCPSRSWVSRRPGGSTWAL